ncbi:hypothetical protein Pcinc_039345 [Petrolisthes cinctipes]|uniref:Uncharacterized protein n=1 Tax=Petrolisthes cinctipes TaxID=88211 RepID=A0AAE1BRF8_PETCI|nr:hypothetical protein Pcinc_039345 [Petrolisthes cinctipes]
MGEIKKVWDKNNMIANPPRHFDVWSVTVWFEASQPASQPPHVAAAYYGLIFPDTCSSPPPLLPPQLGYMAPSPTSSPQMSSLLLRSVLHLFVLSLSCSSPFFALALHKLFPRRLGVCGGALQSEPRSCSTLLA